MRRTPRTSIALALAALASSVAPSVALPVASTGCSASARAGLDGTTYKDDQVAFRVGDVPTAWSRVDVEGASLAFRDEPHRASVMVNARCGRKDDDTPLVALSAHLVMGTTAREIASQETIPFDAREALHTRMRAKLDGVPLSYDLYVLKKDGCVYDFVYVGDPRAIEAGVPEFERFVGGFHTLPGAGRT